jgi:YGGT family
VAIEQVDQTTVTQAPVAGAVDATVRTDTHRISRMSPGRNELARRIVVLVFGLIQVVIGARIVLLLLDAREANPIVSAILNFSQIFVAPFEGILRTDSLNAAGSVLDVAAIVALVGWTVIELIVLWALGIFRREPV